MEDKSNIFSFEKANICLLRTLVDDPNGCYLHLGVFSTQLKQSFSLVTDVVIQLNHCINRPSTLEGAVYALFLALKWVPGEILPGRNAQRTINDGVVTMERKP